jgi:hypothetical protein
VRNYSIFISLSACVQTWWTHIVLKIGCETTPVGPLRMPYYWTDCLFSVHWATMPSKPWRGTLKHVTLLLWFSVSSGIARWTPLFPQRFSQFPVTLSCQPATTTSLSYQMRTEKQRRWRVCANQHRCRREILCILSYHLRLALIISSTERCTVEPNDPPCWLLLLELFQPLDGSQ